ncbi:hypothetical protein ACFQU7_34955 [Pseudoroseomonas wenyumeiae]
MPDGQPMGIERQLIRATALGGVEVDILAGLGSSHGELASHPHDEQGRGGSPPSSPGPYRSI